MKKENLIKLKCMTKMIVTTGVCDADKKKKTNKNREENCIKMM